MSDFLDVAAFSNLDQVPVRVCLRPRGFLEKEAKLWVAKVTGKCEHFKTNCELLLRPFPTVVTNGMDIIFLDYGLWLLAMISMTFVNILKYIIANGAFIFPWLLP